MPSVKKITKQRAIDRSSDCISVIGARTHNLKNISVDIPRDQLVVITGRSGSGKSSLAFDTIYAEGQRQFMESLSLYSRQFLGSLPAADVRRIDGLQPTLCLDQNYRNRDRRSTVGTISEVYHYLCLLMARVGEIHCYQCGQPIHQQTAHEIRDSLLKLPERTKLMILAPLVRGEKGRHADVLRKVRREGLVRVRIDGTVFDIDETPELNPQQPHTIEVVADRIIVREGVEGRLLEAIENSTRLADGTVIICRLEPGDSTGADASTPGTWQDVLYSTRYACAKCDIHYAEVSPRTFNFNSPFGACEQCQGVGYQFEFDPQVVVGDRARSVADGAISALQSLSKSAVTKQLNLLKPVLSHLGLSRTDPLSSLSDSQWETFLYSTEKQTIGLMALLQRELATSLDEDRLDDLDAMQDRVTCRRCHGFRVNAQSLGVFLKGRHVGELVDMSIDKAIEFFRTLEIDGHNAQVAVPLIREIQHRLEFLQHVGTGYLSLGRSADTLSGGEHQRVRLATSIGSGLTGVCFVLDEPSIGLHQRDNNQLIETIRTLQRSGNSLLVVEHDRAMIEEADYILDLGPGAGLSGGEVVAAGTAAEVAANADSLTGSYLSGTANIKIPKRRRDFDRNRVTRMSGANANNLQNVTVEIPTGLFTCVTGVSGSGKSTLINDTLVPAIKRELNPFENVSLEKHSLKLDPRLLRMVVVDQKPIGRSTRACPATHVGLFDHFRKLFAATRKAKQAGFGIGRFSFNSRTGWCPECKGHGTRRVEMGFMPDLHVDCELCGGKRFDHAILQIRFGDLNIADVLDLTVTEALDRFDGFEKIRRILAMLNDVGLGYLKLGQSTITLSGGELQRIKLATDLARDSLDHTLYVLDEPTTGLHFDDVRQLITVLQAVVDRGHTLVVIEHDLDVIKCADWVIDLGPEGGQGGGQVVATGTPEQVATVKQSWTGQYLQSMLASPVE